GARFDAGSLTRSYRVGGPSPGPSLPRRAGALSLDCPVVGPVHNRVHQPPDHIIADHRAVGSPELLVLAHLFSFDIQPTAATTHNNSQQLTTTHNNSQQLTTTHNNQ